MLLAEIPEQLRSCKQADLVSLIPELTLLELPGERPEPLVVSVLLHGNELTSLKVMQLLLQKYQGQNHILPRPLLFLIGNPRAAATGVRHLDDQPDYNRIWLPGPSPQHTRAGEILDWLKTRRPFAAIDIHNNTGTNPLYPCINRLDHEFLQLAGVFQRNVVYFIKPEGVFAKAMAPLCPSVTIECGRSLNPTGVAAALNFVDSVLHMDQLPSKPLCELDLNIFHLVGRIKVPAQASLDFAPHRHENANFVFIDQLEENNFRTLPPGTLLGWRNREDLALLVLDEEDQDRSAQYIDYTNGEIRLRTSVTPSMLTIDQEIIFQDCLGYIMETIRKN